PLRRQASGAVRSLLWAALLSSSVVLLFITSVGLSSQRYQIDFLPLPVLVAIANFGIYIARAMRSRRIAIGAFFSTLVAYSVVANLGLGLVGPYNDVLRNRPATYLRLARWFSPVERFRPMLNPAIAVDLKVHFRPHDDAFREPLVTIGDQIDRFF